MSQTPVEYKYLGNTTFLLLTIKRLGAFFAYVLIVILLSLLSYLIPTLHTGYVNGIIGIAFLIGLIILAIIIVVGWLEYTHYVITLNEQGIKVKHGILSEEEIGIPYRRVKEVRIKRSPIDQVIGVSSVIITILGEDNGEPLSKESVFFLPALTKDVAEKIQEEILARAQVDEISVNGSGRSSTTEQNISIKQQTK